MWSDWTPMLNPTNNGIITEKRTRFVCSMGSSQDEQVSQIKSDSIVYRMCHNQERTDCQETGLSSNHFLHKSFQYLCLFFSIDSLESLHFDDWSPWSTWSGKFSFFIAINRLIDDLAIQRLLSNMWCTWFN